MNKVLAPILGTAIRESLANYESKRNGSSLRDLYSYHNPDDNSLVIYDDTNTVLNNVQLTDEQYFNIAHILRQVLYQLGKERLFDRNYITKPFAVSLVDKDFVVLEELFFLDEDMVKMSNAYWKAIEKDLDDFLDNLLK